MHNFILSIDNGNKCAKQWGTIRCNRPEIDHTENATCEACPNVGPCELYSAEVGQQILLCSECIKKEEAVRNSPDVAQKRVNQIIEKSKQIDSTIQIRSDIFNAQTTSIIELKDAINADESIKDKHFHLAQLLTDRLNGFKKAIFEINEELVSKATEQRAVQTYLNELSNKLRIEQREQIKLEDINYQPNPVKISKPRSVTPVRRFDKTELNKYAIKLGLPNGMSVIQTVCIANNMTPEQAYNKLKESMGL